MSTPDSEETTEAEEKILFGETKIPEKIDKKKDEKDTEAITPG